MMVMRKHFYVALAAALATNNLVGGDETHAASLRAEFDARGREQCGRFPWWRPVEKRMLGYGYVLPMVGANVSSFCTSIR